MLCPPRPFGWGLFTFDGPLGRVAFLLAAGGAAVTAACATPVRLGLVSGRSMEPTLRPGQVFCYRPLEHRSRTLRRGDVVLLHMGRDVCVKRVFALGGECFWMVHPSKHPVGTWFPLNPDESVARWRKRYPTFGYRRFRVPPGQVYVLGDGPCSVDSRTFGAIPARQVFGRVVLPATPLPAGAVNSRSFRALPPRPPPPPAPASLPLIASSLSS